MNTHQSQPARVVARRPGRYRQFAVLLAVLLACSSACSKKGVFQRKPLAMPAYQGPSFLRETLDAMTRVSGFQPLLVSGYGLAVGLDGQGSEVVPKSIRQHMLIMAHRGGIGNQHLAKPAMTPQRLLDSRDTAVVEVRGLVPPGATRGTRFDLLVSTLAQSQVTSLAGGTVWSTQLSILGLDPTMNNRPMATASGPLFTKPLVQTESRPDALHAVVINGGIVGADRRVRLELLQPNYNLAADISDRINERFPKREARFPNDPAADRDDVAAPKSDSTIHIHIPKRYAADPRRFLQLILHLHLQRGPNFELQKAHELAQALEHHPQSAPRVALAWEALGRSAQVALRQYFDAPSLVLRLSALEAAARLGDQQTVPALRQLSKHPQSQMRLQTAKILGHLRVGIRAPQILHGLLNDTDQDVRLAAYEALASNNDPIIHRTPFLNDNQRVKFVLDLVPSRYPLILVAQAPMPRVVIFDRMLELGDDQIISLWDNALMLRRDGEQRMKVFFQGPDETEPIIVDCLPMVANFIYLMAHRPTPEHSMTGFDLPFSQIVNALHTLCATKKIESDIELRLNPTLHAMAEYQPSPDPVRPDFSQAEHGS